MRSATGWRARASKKARDAGVRSYRRRDLAAAQRALRRAMRLDPASRTGWLYLARSERDAGDLHRSLETIETALERHPDWPAGIWHAADLHLRRGDAAAAQEALRSLESLEAHGEVDLVRIGQLATRAGANDVASQAAERLLEQGQAAEPVARFATQSYLREGRWEEALEAARELAGGDPEQLQPIAREFREAGFLAYRGADHETARLAFEASVLLNPDNRSASLYLARAQRNRGRLEDSLATITAALERHPDWPAGIWHAADLQVRMRRPIAAQETLRTLRPMDDHDHEELLRIGRLAMKVGEAEVARDVLRHLLGRDPDNHEALELAAELTLSMGDEEDALAIADRLIGSGRSYSGSATAARIFLRAGRVTAALSVVERLDTEDPKTILPIARALRRHGFLAEAERLLGAAAEDDPQVRELEQLVAGSRRVFVDGWRPSPPPPVEMQPVEGRVLHVTGSSLPHRQSGYTMRTHRTVLAQRAGGLEPHVLTYAGFPADGSAPELETVDDVPHHRIPHPDGARLPADRRLQVSLEGAVPVATAVRPSVLHPASDFHNALVALGLRDVVGAPVVYEVRGFWEETWLSRQPDGCERSDAYLGRREAERACMLEADHVVTLSETMKQHIVERGIDPAKVTVVPNGVDCAAFHPTPRDPGLAERLGIRETDTVVGCISSLVDYEGFEDLVRAVALLGETGEDVPCLLVGDGPERDRLAVVAAELGISDRVILPGSVHHAEILAYYGLIDVFALPRRPHRVCDLVQPLKPFEAMATGCALVVSDREALREMVSDGETGLVAASGDPRSLADALAWLIEDRALRESLAGAAREWVRAERSWERNAAAYREVYAAVRPA